MSDVNTRSTTGPTLTTPVLVYDGDCAFCTSCVRWLERRTRRPLRSIAYQSADLSALCLTRAQCADAVQWVATDSTRSGHLAVAAALRHSRAPWSLVGLIIGLPVIRWVASVVYRRVAARRRCVN